MDETDQIVFTNYKAIINYNASWRLCVSVYEKINGEVNIYNNIISENGEFIYEINKSTAEEANINISISAVMPIAGFDDVYGYLGRYNNWFSLTIESPVQEITINISDLSA